MSKNQSMKSIKAIFSSGKNLVIFIISSLFMAFMAIFIPPVLTHGNSIAYQISLLRFKDVGSSAALFVLTHRNKILILSLILLLISIYIAFRKLYLTCERCKT